MHHRKMRHELTEGKQCHVRKLKEIRARKDERITPSQIVLVTARVRPEVSRPSHSRTTLQLVNVDLIFLQKNQYQYQIQSYNLPSIKIPSRQSHCAECIVASRPRFPVSASLDRRSHFSRSPFSTPHASRFPYPSNFSPISITLPGTMVSGDRSRYTA